MGTPAASLLPTRLLPVLDPDGTFTLAWYRTLQALSSGSGGALTPADVEALIAAALVPVEADIANALAVANEALLEAGGLNTLTLLNLSALDGYRG